MYVHIDKYKILYSMFIKSSNICKYINIQKTLDIILIIQKLGLITQYDTYM